MGRFMALLQGVALGAGLMYFYDPKLGDRRRKQLSGQVTQTLTEAGDTLEKSSRTLRAGAQELAAEVRSSFTTEVAENVAPNWSPATRLLVGATGGVLALYGKRQGGLIGAAASTVGISLLTGCIRNTKIRLRPSFPVGPALDNAPVEIEARTLPGAMEHTPRPVAST